MVYDIRLMLAIIIISINIIIGAILLLLMSASCGREVAADIEGAGMCLAYKTIDTI